MVAYQPTAQISDSLFMLMTAAMNVVKTQKLQNGLTAARAKWRKRLTVMAKRKQSRICTLLPTVNSLGWEVLGCAILHTHLAVARVSIRAAPVFREC